MEFTSLYWMDGDGLHRESRTTNAVFPSRKQVEGILGPEIPDWIQTQT
jgi:hypothetical protein